MAGLPKREVWRACPGLSTDKRLRYICPQVRAHAEGRKPVLRSWTSHWWFWKQVDAWQCDIGGMEEGRKGLGANSSRAQLGVIGALNHFS
jgi:hypothetical protein